MAKKPTVCEFCKTETPLTRVDVVKGAYTHYKPKKVLLCRICIDLPFVEEYFRKYVFQRHDAYSAQWEITGLGVAAMVMLEHMRRSNEQSP